MVKLSHSGVIHSAKDCEVRRRGEGMKGGSKEGGDWVREGGSGRDGMGGRWDGGREGREVCDIWSVLVQLCDYLNALPGDHSIRQSYRVGILSPW